MPVYEYVCKRCGEEFVLLQKMGATEKDTTCPKCGSQEARKKLSAFSYSSNTGLGIPSHSTGGHS